jgi:hypothetical protein
MELEHWNGVTWIKNARICQNYCTDIIVQPLYAVASKVSFTSSTAAGTVGHGFLIAS